MATDIAKAGMVARSAKPTSNDALLAMADASCVTTEVTSDSPASSHAFVEPAVTRVVTNPTNIGSSTAKTSCTTIAGSTEKTISITLES